MIRLFAIAFVLGLVSTTPSRAQDDLKDRVAKAIAAGQKYLKDSRAAGNENNLIGRDGVNAGALMGLVGGNGSGTPCLTGLALIESGLDGRTPSFLPSGIPSANRS